MAELADLLAAELDRITRPVVREDLRDLSVEERRAALPLATRQRIARDAGPVGSREYRSAMRRLQRYVTGAGEIRRPSRETLRRLNRAAFAGRIGRRSTRARITGLVQVSEDARRRTVVAVIAPGGMAPVIAAYLAGAQDRAAARFLRAFVESYGVAFRLLDTDAVRLDPTEEEEET